ncbi:hypothetical protein Agub_g2840, partial [Astrephomene gubernaculifera]
KRKLVDVSRTEADDCQRVRARLEHLSCSSASSSSQDPTSTAAASNPTSATPATSSILPWPRQRLDVLLTDHLLRAGHHNTACRLASESDIALLTDAHIFQGARRILSALLESHDVLPALAWCAHNRSRLTKAKSALEFRLHVQQFIELVRRGERLAAIAYARKQLAPWAATHMTDFQRAVATLVFHKPASSSSAAVPPPTPPCSPRPSGAPWPTSSCATSTACTPSRPSRCSMSTCRRASPRSKPPPPPAAAAPVPHRRSRAEAAPPKAAVVTTPCAFLPSSAWPSRCRTPSTRTPSCCVR